MARTIFKWSLVVVYIVFVASIFVISPPADVWGAIVAVIVPAVLVVVIYYVYSWIGGMVFRLFNKRK